MFAKHFFAPIQVSWRQSVELLTPWRHSSYVQKHRAMLIVSRVQLISAIFGFLVPLWIVIDALAFTPSVWMTVAPARIVAGLIFLALAWPWPLDQPQRAARLKLTIMLLVPAVFHVATEPVVAAVEPSGFAGVVRESYRYLLFTVVAGLSIFPLTAIEVAASAALVLAAMVAALLIEQAFDWQTFIGPMWLLLLIVGTAMVSCMSQLHYMMALVRRVTFDALTGALTRRSGADLLETEFRLSALSGRPLAVAFLDLDRFKQINDNFGHDAGDTVLRVMVERLSAKLRQGDTLIRWGGEEFLVIFAGTDKEGVRQAILRLGAGGFGERPDGRPVTTSIGIAERLADGIEHWGELVECADRRMYEAKTSGRNCAVFGGGDIIAEVIREDRPALVE